MSEIELTISIVNTNNKKLLESCLESIYKNTRIANYEIIVVDNYSTDDSIGMIRKYYPKVKVILNDSRRGYGYSHNRAFAISKGNYFLILNEDMIIKEKSIDKMLEIIIQNKGIGALGCKLLNPDETLQHSCSNFPTLLQAFFENMIPYNFAMTKNRLRRHLFYWDHNQERDVDIIMGSCMLIPRKVIDEIGLFDEIFYIYSEEDDLCKRINEAGWRVYFTPEAEIIHYGGQATTKIMPIKTRIYQLDSKIKYFKKHHGNISALILKIEYMMGFKIRIIGWYLFSIFYQDKKRKYARKAIKIYWTSLLWLLGKKINSKIENNS